MTPALQNDPLPDLPLAPPAERPVCWCVIEEVGRGVVYHLQREAAARGLSWAPGVTAIRQAELCYALARALYESPGVCEACGRDRAEQERCAREAEG